ncbi:MAG: hypothetical protein J7L15_04260 [Clostridiales bacterium]|nr:hypothetical protein [Clostridiales bacterium]
MPKYSQRSLEKLSTAVEDLQILFKEVIKHFDNTILWGHRDKEAQEKAFAEGKTQVHYPHSKHNSMPSKAVDAVTYPINWNDINQHYYFAGYVKGVADRLYDEGIMKHKIRCGADWNKNMLVSDERFMDLFHFEIID